MLRLTLSVTLAVLVGYVAMTAHAQTPPSSSPSSSPSTPSHKFTNALADETSPYLLQHAHNPVDWQPWGEAAFERARREQKPIFLSVGYSTCYWCHVMERQVFENEALAKLLNERFVAVKVDREERPDVDDLYMTAVQMMTGRGGWPMSVFLTPPAPGSGKLPEGIDKAAAEGYGLRPFWAGTYIPPEPAHGIPGFGQVVTGLSDAWRDRRRDVLLQADQVAEGVAEHMKVRDDAGTVTKDTVQRTVNGVLRQYDAKHGGFGDAPKFPEASKLLMLFDVLKQTRDDDLWDAVATTLDEMAQGGMYDQVGGGFHRYSTDAKWLVPHFEKMLYDQGQLLEVYARGYEAAKVREDEVRGRRYERVMRETADYLLHEMTDDTGAFYSAEDAETNASEGESYLWTPEQVKATIEDETLAAFALKLYGLDKGTNFVDPHDPAAKPVNVLYLPEAVETLGEGAEGKRREVNRLLKATRDRRDQPRVDDKVLVGWNGMAIAGLAEAGRVLDEPRYVEAAARAADAIADHLSVNDADAPGLWRTMRGGEVKHVPAYLEDYADYVHGLLTLHAAVSDLPSPFLGRGAGGEGSTSATATSREESPHPSPLPQKGEGAGAFDAERYLKLAKQLTRIAVDRFAVEGEGGKLRGGYYDSPAGDEDLFVRTRSTYDGATPSGNSQMVHNLLDLYRITSDAQYLDRAVLDVRSAAQPLRQQGPGLVHMTAAAIELLERDTPRLTRPESPQAEAASAADSPNRSDPMQARTPITVTAKPEKVTWKDDAAKFTVIVDIAEGYHINASRPEDPNLIGTTLELEGVEGFTLEADYPAAKQKTYPFADEPLAVYEGTVRIPVTLRRSAKLDTAGGQAAAGEPDPAKLRVMLQVQACTDSACLPPDLIEVGVRVVSE